MFNRFKKRNLPSARKSPEEYLKNFFNVRDDLQHLPNDEIIKIQKDNTLPYAVCTLSVDSDLNISNIIRTACIFGAEKAIVYGRRKIDRRALVGSQNYIDIERIDGVDDFGNIVADGFFEVMNKYNYVPVILEQGGKHIEDMKNDFDGKPCLVFGSEGQGIPHEIISKCKHIYEIPQRGVMRSLNVSAAASIAIYKMQSIISTK